jgi:tRNA G10  N-methylase Trm11
MLQVLDFNSNGRCLDMFCGRGTILCEAFLKNNQVFGCDIDIIPIPLTKTWT